MPLWKKKQKKSPEKNTIKMNQMSFSKCLHLWTFLSLSLSLSLGALISCGKNKQNCFHSFVCYLTGCQRIKWFWKCFTWQKWRSWNHISVCVQIDFFFSLQFPLIVVASKRNKDLKGKNYVAIRKTTECSGEKGLSIHIPTQKSRCLGLYILKFSFSDSLAPFFA